MKWFGTSAAAAAPALTFVNILVEDILRKAYAQSGSGAAKNYLCFAMRGGPEMVKGFFPANPRKSTASDPFEPNPYLKTKVESVNPDGSKPTFEYETYAFTNSGGQVYDMPWIWGQNTKRKDGSDRPMAELLDQLCIMRGVNMAVNSHDICNQNIQSVPAGSYSHAGHAVDNAASATVGSIWHGHGPSTESFKSPTGKGALGIPYNENSPLEYIMKPYILDDLPDNKKYYENQEVKTAINNAVEKLQEHSDQLQYEYGSIFDDRLSAEEWFQKELDNLQAEYQSLQSKYNNLMSSIRNSFVNGELAGVTDRKVSPLNMLNGGFPYIVTGNKNIQQVPEIWNLKWDDPGNPGHIFLNDDIRDIYANASFNKMSMNFAIAEYCFKNGISNSIVFAVQRNIVQNIRLTDAISIDKIQKSYNPNTNQTTFSVNPSDIIPTLNGKQLDSDSHGTGIFESFFGYSLFFQVFAGSMLELIDELAATDYQYGEGSVWDNTMIHIQGDFERSLRVDGVGTDHGYQGNTVVVACGEFDQLNIVGNVLPRPHSSEGANYINTYPGTWGYHAPVQDLGGPGDDRPLVAGNIASTLAKIGNWESNTPNDISIIEKNLDGKWRPVVETAKNVNES